MTTHRPVVIDLHTVRVAPSIERGALVLRDGRGSEERIPFDSITRVELHQWLPGVHSVRVHRRDRPHVTIRYRHFVALGERAERSADYVDLVHGVLQESSLANPSVRLIAGSTLGLVCGCAASVIAILVALAFVGALNVGDIRTGQPVGFHMPEGILLTAAIMPIAFFIGGGVLQQGWSRSIDPYHPPRLLLPTVLPRSTHSDSP